MALDESLQRRSGKGPTSVALRGIPIDAGIAWAAFLTLLIGAPWLAPGYIFGTDWPGPRHIDPPTALYSSAPLQALLAATAWAIGAEWAGKLLVLGSLFAAGATSFRALPVGGFLPRAAGSAIYVLNPFVYGRLHYGQLYLIAGYALLPWVAMSLRALLLQPAARPAVATALSVAALGMLDLHLVLASVVLSVTLLIAHVAERGDRLGYLVKVAPYAIGAAAVTLLVSSFWIIPLLQGRGPEGATLAGIGSNAILEFEAVPDHRLGLVPNLLGLYGFWAEDAGRFVSMKAYVPVWPAVLAAILLVNAVGGLATMRRDQEKLRPWVGGLLLAGAIALILEMGVSHPATAGLVRWLDAHFSPYRGMRDAGKWAAMLALVYSQLFGLGVIGVLNWLRRQKLGPSTMEWALSAASALLLAVPLGYGNGLLFGSHGGIRPSEYPAGWYAADRFLRADPHPGRTLFLPWHGYLSFDFIRNENEVVACPAPSFFSTPILASTNPEVFGIAPSADPAQVAVSGLLSSGAAGQWARILSGLGVKYILLAKTVDWANYRYLDDQAGIVKVHDYGSLVLYRVASGGG